MTDQEVLRQRQQQSYESPFSAAAGAAPDARLAHATEYAAAQLYRIVLRLDELLKRLDRGSHAEAGAIAFARQVTCFGDRSAMLASVN
jgi:hypothetical protein